MRFAIFDRLSREQRAAPYRAPSSPFVQSAPKQNGTLLLSVLLMRVKGLFSSRHRKAEVYFGFATLLGQRGSDTTPWCHSFRSRRFATQSPHSRQKHGSGGMLESFRPPFSKGGEGCRGRAAPCNTACFFLPKARYPRRVILSGAKRSRTFSSEIPNATTQRLILAMLGFRLRSE